MAFSNGKNGKNGNHSDRGNGSNGSQDGQASGPLRTLIIIGGHEDKKREQVILKEVARRVGAGKMVVTTVASHQPEGYFEEYERVFYELGIGDVALLEIKYRNDAVTEQAEKVLEGAIGVFFTGGDQLKITSQIGGTPVFHGIRRIYNAGGVIAGTSAGASVVCETMLISGTSEETYRIGSTLNMAPGLGLIPSVIIDQHFAERGRMGRLLGAVAQNPRMLGIGIDENTAILVENEERFTVIGEGAVYVVDGTGITSSNIAEGSEDATLSLYDIRLHVLSNGDKFDLRERRPGDLSRVEEARIEMREAETLQTA